MRNVALSASINPEGTDRSAPDARQPDGAAGMVQRERPRLLDFIRRRLPTREDAEDLLQDVLMDWAEIDRRTQLPSPTEPLTQPIEHLAGWLFAVARRKIIDWYRKKRTVSLEDQYAGYADDDGEPLLMAGLLPASDASADEVLMREAIMEAVMEAVSELPDDQREVFVRHELDGQSFRDMADETGIPINTLLSRKRYAVLYLRERLRDLYEDWITN
ncbi:RNA polymerase sigma factor [Larkinella terrae]|uniref:Sigma-70 family RNA polymerase sigma factor n=1 Tax=Larkinella terrae TaxID=2025311 RepID=A0A7K0EE66_9BACT|nr:sigma-70 family RNA polymerase sigma factor [Larkinella terrae]MRS60140.1 sigma-70 family RNA polymerase sigma factor [Larkinella terrae]